MDDVVRMLRLDGEPQQPPTIIHLQWMDGPIQHVMACPLSAEQAQRVAAFVRTLVHGEPN